MTMFEIKKFLRLDEVEGLVKFPTNGNPIFLTKLVRFMAANPYVCITVTKLATPTPNTEDLNSGAMFYIPYECDELIDYLADASLKGYNVMDLDATKREIYLAPSSDHQTNIGVWLMDELVGYFERCRQKGVDENVAMGQH